MAMTYAELLQKYDLLRAVAEAAESLVRAPLGLTAEEIEERHERRMCLAKALQAAKDGGEL